MRSKDVSGFRPKNFRGVYGCGSRIKLSCEGNCFSWQQVFCAARNLGDYPYRVSGLQIELAWKTMKHF